MESPENDRTVFRPSHKPLEINKTDFHIPPATTTTRNICKNPKRSRLKLPASNSPFRLIPGLEKTVCALSLGSPKIFSCQVAWRRLRRISSNETDVLRVYQGRSMADCGARRWPDCACHSRTRS